MGRPEEWRVVNGWGKYEVSNTGRVRRNGRVLTPWKRNGEYRMVDLCIGGKHKQVFVHRIVCCAFHGEPPHPSYHTDHINADPADNRAENLRWLTPAQNLSTRRPRRGEAHSNAKLTDRAVREIRRMGDKTIKEIAKIYGVGFETAREARNGTSWRHVK
jgi:hypothetical protein